MQNFGAFGSPCSKHSKNSLIGFCTSRVCLNRVLCKDCQSEHDKSHHEKFKTLLEVLMSNFDAEFQELEKLHDEYNKKIEDELAKVDVVIEKLRARLEILLEELRVDLLKEIEESLQNKDSLNSMETIFQEHEVKKLVAMSEKEPNRIESVRDQFAESLAKLSTLKEDLIADINTLTRSSPNLEHIDTFPFKKFLKFGLRSTDLTKQNFSWRWDKTRLNENMKLSDDFSAVERISNSNSYAPVFGDLLLEDGVHKWDIHIDCKNETATYICFGIVDFDNSKNISYVNPKLVIGINSSGFPFNITQRAKSLDGYDKKTYSCYLDFEHGSFLISLNKEILFEAKEGIKGKKFYPVCILYDFGNMAQLVNKA